MQKKTDLETSADLIVVLYHLAQCARLSYIQLRVKSPLIMRVGHNDVAVLE